MSSKRSPRAMPVETIITRFKSRHQQFDNERHKNDTKPKSQITKPQPLKQYVRKPKMKPSKDFQKSFTKTNDVSAREFYPDKPKRKIEYKKVVLLPKHSMKMIGGTNSCSKRKLHMPRKEIKRSRHNSNTSTLSEIEPKSPKHKDQAPELTIKDMVLLIEEEGGLSGEDLLEILTCPSPVWWEDPPNGYIEDPIFARPKPEEQISVKNQLLEEQKKEAERRKQRDEESSFKAKDAENLDVSKLGISIENRGVNFMNRRCKLESLLGNLRNNVKKDSNGFKNVDNKVSDDGLNAELNVNFRENDKNENQTVELKQKTVEDIAKIQSIEKCDKKIDYHTHEKQKVELKPKNIGNRHKKIEDKINKLSASFKAKKNRHKNIYIDKKGKAAMFKLKKDVKVDQNRDRNVIKNLNEECTSKSNNNCDKTNMNQEDITTGYKEQRSSDSFEDDPLLDLEDHEILSLENIQIPIASNNATKPVEISEVPVKINELTDKQTIGTHKRSTKTSSLMLDNGLGNKANSTEKEVHCIGKIVTDNKLVSNEVKKHVHINPTNPTIKHQNTNNQIKEINKIDKSRISYIRVRKPETLFNFNSNGKINILQNNLSNNDDNPKNGVLSNEELFSAGCKDDIRLNDIKPVQTVGTSNFTSDVLRSYIPCNVRPVNSETSKLVSESKDVRNIGTALANYNLSEIESLKNMNTHLSEISTPFLVDDNISRDRVISSDFARNTSEEPCIIIDDVDCDDNINNSPIYNKFIDDKLMQNNTSIQIKNKITDSHGQNKNIHIVCVNKARRCSVDSATSDKNMSVEYLDMSLLDEDEPKIELDSQNNEFNYESDDFQSQSDSQSCNKNNHIDFKSDLDMTDSNMYDQINESCNNDIIKYIRDNQKDTDAEKEIVITDIRTLNDNLKSSSPNQEKANPIETKEPEYVEVYKIINSDSDNESNLLKTNGVNTGKLNEINEVNLTKIEKSAMNKSNETSVVESNEIDVTEFITYEEEYLTEFDEIEIIGNDNSDGNFIKIGEIRDSTLNTSENRFNGINEVVNSHNIHNHGNVIKVNAENARDNINDNDLTKISEVSDNTFKNPVNLNTADSSKTNDTINKLNNYYKHRKDIRKIKIIPDNTFNKENHENDKKIDCKSCSFKNKSILISENDTVKYCLVCSSIYDTDNCKYCIKRFKKECSCKNLDLEYVCDKCNIKVCDKEAIIEHLKNCKMDSHTAP